MRGMSPAPICGQTARTAETSADSGATRIGCREQYAAENPDLAAVPAVAADATNASFISAIDSRAARAARPPSATADACTAGRAESVHETTIDQDQTAVPTGRPNGSIP